MAQIRFANNVSTQLTKPVAADDSTIEVRSLTHGFVWPNISATGDYFLIVIDDVGSSYWEILKCTKVSIADNITTLTVERGLEGTAPSEFQAGSIVENRLTAGTLDTFGAGFPAKVEINRGGTGATTAADARTNLDVPSKADLSSEVNTRTSEVARLDQKIIDNVPPAATTSVRGTVILSSATDSVSEAMAATPKAVKTAYDKAVAVDTRLTSEVTTLEAADTATNQTLTSEVSRLEGEIAAHTPPDASLTTKGIVQLSSAINSESETTAATSKAIKLLADSISVMANVPVGGIIAFSGTFGGSDNRYPIPLGSTTTDTNWCLCDGTTTNNLPVPDLRGRMIMGVSNTYKAGATGGSTNHSHSLSGTVGATTLSTTQMPSHTHNYTVGNGGNWEASGASYRECTENIARIPTSSTGGSASHTHTLSGASKKADNLPPYYALSYIMRIA